MNGKVLWDKNVFLNPKLIAYSPYEGYTKRWCGVVSFPFRRRTKKRNFMLGHVSPRVYTFNGSLIITDHNNFLQYTVGLPLGCMSLCWSLRQHPSFHLATSPFCASWPPSYMQSWHSGINTGICIFGELTTNSFSTNPTTIAFQHDFTGSR